MKLEHSAQILEKSLNIKFSESLLSGSRVVPCGRADMTKPIVAFRNFAKASKRGESEFTPVLIYCTKMASLIPEVKFLEV
jgi:hypothetical protein